MGPRRIGLTLGYGREPVQSVPANCWRRKCRTARHQSRPPTPHRRVKDQSRGGAGCSVGRAASGTTPVAPTAGATTDAASTGSPRAIASKTSRRCTGTSFGASTPSRTLSPRISTTTIVMSLLMTMLSSFFRDSTSIGPILGGADPSPTRLRKLLNCKGFQWPVKHFWRVCSELGGGFSAVSQGDGTSGALIRTHSGGGGHCRHLGPRPFVRRRDGLRWGEFAKSRAAPTTRSPLVGTEATPILSRDFPPPDTIHGPPA